MTLHIGIEGVDGVGKSTIVNMLVDYFVNNDKQQKYEYKVRRAIQPVSIEIISMLKKYRLSNQEIALLMAFDRLFSYYNEDWSQYDLVFWDRSILSSYAYNTDKQVPNLFIKQINRYFPDMDLYIIIKHNKLLKEQDYTVQSSNELISKYNTLINEYPNTYSVEYVKDDIDKVFNEILKIINTKLPKCKYCGKHYKPTGKYKKYHDKKCSKKAWEDNNLVNNRNFYHKYKNTMSERRRGALGSKGANLHGKPDNNPLRELEKIRNAKRKIGLL